ncbi:hypothetical protein A3Q56_08364 [Intoshia linei]|uniref:Uncharacterized protein n=1 Tax=Intoshia linei TaxID=1819745 RepID=A0A177ARR7_9BILA|nr:hypothetical protein A3Q56_08364 [Intoshia linei]
MNSNDMIAFMIFIPNIVKIEIKCVEIFHSEEQR